MPEGGFHHHPQGYGLLVPDPVAIGSFDLKHVHARPQVGVSGRPPAGVGVIPLVLEVLEHIGVAVLVGGGEVKGGETE